MVQEVHDPPIVWQLAHVVLVIGAVVWLAGRPACGTTLAAVSWQPDWVQFVAAVTPWWLNVAGSQAAVAWQDEHCVVVLMWVGLAGVQPLPA